MARRHELEALADERLGAELGTIHKEAPLRVSLVYPSPYHVAMSSLGYQTIYRLINRRADASCERAFLPDDADDSSDVPLFTYESKRLVADADVLAFSIAYETEVLGLIQCLRMAGVPLRSADRGDGWPLILFGGPLTFSNPLPVAPFCDVMVMGEGDELVDRLLDLWQTETDRADFFQAASRLPGVYVPSVHGERLVQVAQAADSYLPAYSQIITPNTELRNMHLVENARGCHRGCTFCVMRRTTNSGMRVAAVDDVLATIPDYAERVGLVGAATMDHPEIRTILREIVDSGRDVGLSSLRADRLDAEFVELLARGGGRTLTIAADGTSERIRKIAQKGIKAHHLVRSAELVREFDLRLLKIYMVFGYPEETMADVDEMIELITELSKICRVALGMSPLVAKKNTPLDGVAFQDSSILDAKIKAIRKGLKGRAEIRSTSVRWAWIEYQLAQGGWAMADAAEAALDEGGSYAAWKRAIKRYGGAPAPVRRPPDDRIRPGALLDA